MSSRTPSSRSSTRFVEDGLHRAADRCSLDERDGAKSAGTAAAIGHLQVGAGAGHACAQRVVFIRPNGGGFGQVVERLRMRLGAQLADDLHNVYPAARAENAVYARHLLGHLCAVALRQAASGNQQLPFALLGGQFFQRGERFFFGRADEAAGVDNQHPGFARGLDRFVAILHEQLRHRI